MKRVHIFICTMFMLGAVCINPQNAIAQTNGVISEQAARDSIQQTVSRITASWNIHDAKAFAALFAQDADFTNVFGQSATGRADIEKFHAPLFSSIFKASVLTNTNQKIRFIKPDVAAVDLFWGMTGATSPDGKPWPDRKGLLNCIMMPQQNGQWVIVVMHNMDLQAPPGR